MEDLGFSHVKTKNNKKAKKSVTLPILRNSVEEKEATTNFHLLKSNFERRDFFGYFMNFMNLLKYLLFKYLKIYRAIVCPAPQNHKIFQNCTAPRCFCFFANFLYLTTLLFLPNAKLLMVLELVPLELAVSNPDFCEIDLFSSLNSLFIDTNHYATRNSAKIYLLVFLHSAALFVTFFED